MNFKGSGCSLLLYLSVVVCSHAIGVPNLRIQELVNTSDVIAVVDVTNVKITGAASPVVLRGQTVEADDFTSEVTVRRTLKGMAYDRLTVTYAVPKLYIGYERLQPGTRMVFLRREGAHYTFANPYYPDFPAVLSLHQPSESAATDYVSAVIHEIAEVIASDTAPSNEKAQILQISYALPANAEVIAALRSGLLNAGQDELKRRFQIEMIRLGDVSQLPEVAQMLLANSVSPNEKIGFLHVIDSWVKDPRAIPAMESLLSASDSAIRAAAMGALWHIGSPKAKAALLSGLDDPNQDVRYSAVRGLAEIIGEVQWAPSVAEFHEHEQRYLNHWKEWVRSASPQ